MCCTIRSMSSSKIHPIQARRLFLRQSAAGISALAAHLSILSAAQPRAQGKARSVILIFNCGAPSHIDLWDPKPDAPGEVRGPFKPIATNVAGIRVSEL